MSEFQVVLESQIDGEFEGFDDSNIFKLFNGTFWIQDEYKYWYYYSYSPRVQIIRGHGRLFIRIENQSEMVAVRQISDVIESQINGEFKGWDGETKYELANGQIWQQSSYKYEYKYAYMPEVLIYNNSGSHLMTVEGTTAEVRRLQ